MSKSVLILARVSLILLSVSLVSCQRKSNFELARNGVVTRDIKTLDSLLKADPKLINAVSGWDSSTLLHTACTNVVDHKMVVFLVGAGASCNALDDQKRSPLHNAYIFDAEDETIKYLLSNGANPNLVDVDGKKPKDYAK